MVQVLDFCGLLFLFVAACHTYKDYLRAHLLGLHTTQTMLRLTNGDMGFLSHLGEKCVRVSNSEGVLRVRHRTISRERSGKAERKRAEWGERSLRGWLAQYHAW